MMNKCTCRKHFWSPLCPLHGLKKGGEDDKGKQKAEPSQKSFRLEESGDEIGNGETKV